MRGLKLFTAVGGVCLMVAWAVPASLPYWFAPKTARTVDIADSDLVTKGAYIARAGDCAACHTAPGGADFAGGLAMQSPLGAIYSTNITPDPETGIGDYDFGDFERAVRQGLRPDGSHLYPAMPYASYRIVSETDIEALYAYFRSVEPVVKPNQPTTIAWPMNLRWPLGWWALLFSGKREFIPPDDPSLVRGAYLVEGLGHCGACHTPRGLAFEEKALREDGETFLAGSVLEGWYAKTLRDEAVGLSTWSQEELVQFLGTGRNARTAAFGSMTDVVQHSLQYLAAEDLQAIARYLKSLPARSGRDATFTPEPDLTTAALREGNYSAPGALGYVEHCQTCHRADGLGAPEIYPTLKGNSMILADDPSSLIQVTLAGSSMPHTPSHRMAFTMPAFGSLPDGEVAEILSFIRDGWGNGAAPVLPEAVARIRHELTRRPTHFAPEATQ